MHTDQQGNFISGAAPNAIEHYSQAARAFNLYSGDPFIPLDRAIAEAPEFAMAHILKATLFAVSTEPAATLEAQKIIGEVRALPLNEREESLLQALSQLACGNWTAAATTLDYHSALFPHDLIALQCGHLMDFYRANGRDLRDRIARTLPHWSAEIPGYSVILGMYAFGLEECGDYARAEEFAHGAIELEPFDCWAHHAAAHVMEMQERTAEGIDWMKSREPFWAGEENFFRVHNWWHCALYHLDRGETDAALYIYDGPIRGGHSAMALDLVDASALLWRLTLLGCDVESRWGELAQTWKLHADGRCYPFNDWHATMALLGAGCEPDIEHITNTIRAGRDNDSEVSRWAWHTGLPLIEGFVAFWRGEYQRSVEHLHSARYIANTFGGSHAQRDIIDWTLTEAAVRTGRRPLAEAFASERHALKPASVVTRNLVIRAAAASPSGI